MAIAQLTHILEEGCRRWLVARTDADRADNEAWVREYLDRPLSRGGVEALLAGGLTLRRRFRRLSRGAEPSPSGGRPTSGRSGR